MRQKREKRLKEIYETQKKAILPLNERKLFIAGLLLYWGEGAKSKMDSLSISNNDPSIVRINHKGGFGHGTCNLRINSVPLAGKIFMSLKTISDWRDKRLNARVAQWQ